MTRVIGGSFKGRRLVTPSGDSTRPTSDRVREALFGSLDAANALQDARVLDLYAGSGAVGLEAASRGAAFVQFIEAHRRAVQALRNNIHTLGVREHTTVTVGNLPGVLRHDVPPTCQFDLVYLDAPYSLENTALQETLSSLVEYCWLTADADVVVERSNRSGRVLWPDGISKVRSRRYGETTLWYGHSSWT